MQILKKCRTRLAFLCFSRRPKPSYTPFARGRFCDFRRKPTENHFFGASQISGAARKWRTRARGLLRISSLNNFSKWRAARGVFTKEMACRREMTGEILALRSNKPKSTFQKWGAARANFQFFARAENRFRARRKNFWRAGDKNFRARGIKFLRSKNPIFDVSKKVVKKS